MLVALSPAKTLDLDPVERGVEPTQPALLDQAESLVKTARRLSKKKLQDLMGISKNLAELNHERFQSFETPFTEANAKMAALTFAGGTYVGLDAGTLSDADLAWAQQGHLAMLSGLYGVLRPLDLMQAYRLEMGTSLATRRGKNLYAFWGKRITDQLNAMTEGHADRTVVCCASAEYWKSVQTERLAGGHVTCVFKERKDGDLKMIGLMAKRARGMMARWMVTERVERREDLRGFAEDDYRYDPALSSDAELVFTRDWRPGALTQD